MRFDEHFLKGVLSHISFISKKFPKEIIFSVDSRTVRRGEIFVAIEGEKFDGHRAIEDALKKGAAGVFFKESKKHVLETIDAKLLKDKLVVALDDTVGALVKMATAWRAQFACPVVAITGSVGKTSTKEMISNILQANKTEHVASFENQNTMIGLSLNVLKMRKNHKAAIFELGITKRGDMSVLVDILRPTISLITSVGHSHMEGLGSLNDIAAEKREVFKYFSSESIGIINGDQPILADVGYDYPMIKFGSKTTNQIQARKIRLIDGNINFIIKIYDKKYNVVLEGAHSGSVYNALASVCVAHLLNIPEEKTIEGVQVPINVSSRFEKRKMKNKKGVLISDCYNASPESMKAALLAIDKIDTDSKKIVVLGDMLELGVNSPFWHRQLGRILRKAPSLRHVILVGDMVSWTKKTLPIGVEAEHVKDWQEAVEKLDDMMNKDSLVLVKGSNSMNLISLVDHFAS
ncbi:UDP-N-acetylmuramoyl-tripeptide--D-alanyl-D-alanine ligase [Candidatus Dependentiae bacterium]